MAATSPPAAGGGSFLTRKLGPLPMWVWVGLGVAALYFYQSRKAAAQTAAGAGTDATTAALAQQGAAAAQYGYTAPDLASMISNLQGQVSLLGGGNNGTTGTGANSPGSTGNPATATLSGSGYYVPGSEAPVTGGGGHTYEWIPNPTVLKALPKGTPVFYQPVPGSFVQGTGAYGIANLAPNTPLFLQVS